MGKIGAWAGWFGITTILAAVTLLPSILLLVHPAPAAVGGIGHALITTAALALAGPALSAAMYSARALTKDERPAPASDFWRGYRMNFADVIKVWFPASLAISLLTFARTALHITGFANLALLLLTGLVLVWALQALTISTFIAMRSGGVARLALLYLFRLGKVVLGVIVAVVVAFIVSGLPYGIYIVAALSALLGYLLYLNARPMIEDATKHYTVTNLPD